MVCVIPGLTIYGLAIAVGLTCIEPGTHYRRIWYWWMAGLGILELVVCYLAVTL